MWNRLMEQANAAREFSEMIQRMFQRMFQPDNPNKKISASGSSQAFKRMI